MIMDIQNTLPLQIERQQPVQFTDAFGRVMPIHLELVDWKEVALLDEQALSLDMALLSL